MANLDFIEKKKIEELFEMDGGYVLDFSNRTFQSFVYEKINIDVYKIYPNLSKAKILRCIMQDKDNITVGKLLLELMRYMQACNMINDTNRELFNQCAEIGHRLIGKKISKHPERKVKEEKVHHQSQINYDSFLNKLMSLSDKTTCITPQQAGYEFEKLIFQLFEASGLSPRKSYKIKGEQIDGSFELDNEIYLLETKWTSDEIGKNELVIFNSKVQSKSRLSRGLFISLSNYTLEALDTFSDGTTICIILMTVQELAILLQKKIPIQRIIRDKIRILAEEGKPYEPMYY